MEEELRPLMYPRPDATEDCDWTGRVTGHTAGSKDAARGLAMQSDKTKLLGDLVTSFDDEVQG